MKKTTWKKRILGCVGFSLITHLGLVAAAFVLPAFANESSPKAQAPTVSNSTVITESAAPVEVVEAAPVAPKSEEQPAPQVIAANDPLPIKDTDVVAPALPSKSHSAKFATSLPEKHAKMIKDTADDADPKLKQALADSRTTEKTSRPEVGGDIPVSVVAQNNMPEQLQPDATFPEESSTRAPVAPIASAPVTAAPAQQPVAQQQPAFAPIQKSAQVSSSASAQGQIRNGDDLKEIAGNTRPVYPIPDRRAGRQGTIVFLARLTPDGQVINIRIEKSSNSPSLDSAAYTAFRTYRYQNGQEGLVRKAFTFALKGEAVEAPVARR